jgi:2-oxoglutarate ferredoxin oxidoreductase subunit beta
MGDGDALAIGGNHFIHTARRNIDLTAIVINNWIYGMTGGQHSPTTSLEKFTTTTPYGQWEPLFDIAQLAVASGATYVARGTAYNVRELDRLIEEGMKKKGFALIEAISQCPTSFGRLNKTGSAVEMLKWQKNHTISVEKAKGIRKEKLQDKIITGIFVNKEEKEYTQAYNEIIAKAKLK